MNVEGLVDRLKVFLNIDIDDTSQDEFLTSCCITASGYMSAYYRYNILDKVVSHYVPYATAISRPIYLPELPVKSDSLIIENNDGTTNDTPILMQGAKIQFTELPTQVDFYVIKYDSGVDDTPIYQGDIEHCVQLASWIYRTADKGLDGMNQISTGVKESVKMFSGIPQNITSYFEVKQPMRL